MDIFDKILNEAVRANKEQDLPDTLLDKISEICTNREKYRDSYMTDDLLGRLIDYEPYGDVGCGNESYSTSDVQSVVDIILEG